MQLLPATQRDCELLDLVMFRRLYGLWTRATSIEDAEASTRRFVARRQASWPYTNADEVVLVCRQHFTVGHAPPP